MTFIGTLCTIITEICAGTVAVLYLLAGRPDRAGMSDPDGRPGA